MTETCKGYNCTSTDGTNNSEECIKEHDSITTKPGVKINKLAERIWEATCEIDYDPLMSNFDNLQEPIKGNLKLIAERLISGSYGLYSIELMIQKFKRA